MRLRHRLIVLVLISILPAFVTLLYGVWLARQERAEQVREEALRLARFTAGELDRIISSVEGQLDVVAFVPGLKSDLGTCNAFLGRLAEQSGSILSVGIADETGHVDCIAPFKPDVNIKDRWYFQEALRDDQFVIGTAVRSQSTGRTVLPLAHAVADADGKRSVIAAGLDLTWLSEYFAARALPKDSVLVIADRGGTIIVRAPIDHKIIGTSIMPSTAWMLAAEKAGTGEFTGRDGIERIAGFVPLAETPKGLFVAVGIGKAAALADLNVAALQSLALLLGLLGLSFAIASIGAIKFLEEPISRLSQIAVRWKAGDLRTRADIPERHSEFYQLASTFNDMAQGLETREADLEEAVKSQKLLIDELNHRVKNTLAVVQALAAQSVRGAASTEEGLQSLNSRLSALAVAHDLLTEKHWQGTELSAVVSKVLAPHLPQEGKRIRLSGPRVELTPKQSISLSMAFHELSTNAVKYGALSNPNGYVDIGWRRKSPGAVEINWKERGGPTVAAPVRRGFGITLLESGLAQDLEGVVELKFDADGVQCRLAFSHGR